MKKNKFRFLFPAAAFVILFAINSYAAQISFMAGDVSVLRDGKKSAAQFQMTLKAGDLISTGKGAFADISYENGTVIKVKENSNITIGNKSVEGSDSVSVTGGVISAKFAKLQKGSQNKVYTPTTVCAIRGTEFEVAVSGSADSKIQLSEGALELLSPYGVSSIKENENAEVGVGSSPKLAEGGNIEEWKTQNETQMDENPEAQSDDFGQYLQKFNERSKNDSKNIKKYEGKQATMSAGGKERMEKANQEIEGINTNVEDDMYLNSAANKSLDGILDKYQQDKKNMYVKYKKLKDESNKVLEQQKKNYEAIKAVKDAYKKAYDDIMKKHKEAVDKIKGSIDTKQYKQNSKTNSN